MCIRDRVSTQSTGTCASAMELVGTVRAKRGVGKFLLFVDLICPGDGEGAQPELIKLALRPLDGGLTQEGVKGFKRDIKRGDVLRVSGEHMESEPGLARVLHVRSLAWESMKCGGNTGLWFDHSCDHSAPCLLYTSPSPRDS
eukprot:TRINITY_DN53016_c0_g1_i1.p2 TRINITY_DN53016_c0_g1~~TRINITY_DN53016_c0_g1_i1.p2  ORF type:complete len:142 (-),score=34.29 TRINITY_DN53016_c0_g1_i1:144-569(-)